MAALKKSLLKRAKKSEGITAKELEALTDSISWRGSS